MSIASMLGWVLIVGAVASIVYAKRNSSAGNKSLLHASPSNSHPEQISINEWCFVLEEMTKSSILIFDDALRLLSLSAGARKLMGEDKKYIGEHLVDICPKNSVTKMLEEISAVRVTKSALWKCVWMKDEVIVRALFMNSKAIVLGIEELQK